MPTSTKPDVMSKDRLATVQMTKCLQSRTSWARVLWFKALWTTSLRAKALVISTALVLLSGCASKPALPDCQQASDELCWQLEAKLGYRSPDKNGSGYVRWQQLGDYSEIYVSGPMGAGASTISISPDGAVLARAGQAPIATASAEALFREVLNFQVPALELRAWLQGQAGPSKASKHSYNEHQQLTQLTQAGWQLNFSRFNDTSADAKPNKIIANNPPYKLTVIVKSRQ